MEFITEAQATELGIDKETIDKITPLYDAHIANEKQSWDGTANANAEKILEGAATKVEEITGVKRLVGEKLADYYVRSGKEFLATKETELSDTKKAYETKLKEAGKGDATANELAETKRLYDEALQKYADYDDVKGKADKLGTLEAEHLTLKQNFALNGIKPNFPDTVNKYEAEAKWVAFVSGLLDKNNIEVVDNVGYAIDKENPHKKTKLSDLVGQDADLTALLQGRTQQGSGTQPANKTVDGVPFAIPENATSEEVSKLINDELDKQRIDKTDKKRAAKFAEYHNAIKAAKK